MYTSLLQRERRAECQSICGSVCVRVRQSVCVRVRLSACGGTCGSTGEREEGEYPNDPPFVPNRPLLPR